MCKTLSCQAVTATYRLGADSQETYYYAKRGQLIFFLIAKATFRSKVCKNIDESRFFVTWIENWTTLAYLS